MENNKRSIFLPLAFGVIAIYAIWGITWGLPSIERTNLFLKPEEGTAEFFAQVDKARDDLYRQMGGNADAEYGRRVSAGKALPVPTMFNAYSAFLIKTHATDEAVTLITLSKINPLKNRWYPYSFVYGGVYLFPLGAFLGTAHALHFIRLVASSTFYYRNPQEIARVYAAARLWSVCGFLVACAALFSVSTQFFGSQAALWAMMFFGLAPTCMAYTKYAKPHAWAAALSLWAIDFALKARKNPEQPKYFLYASLLLGFAIGTTITQVVFLPFILWAVWSKEWKVTFRRGAMMFGIIGSIYFASNFYIAAHFYDFLDEQHFLAECAPFGLNLMALRAFFTSILRISLGWELWLLAMAGLLWALIQKKRMDLRAFTALLVVVIVYVAFKTQGAIAYAPTTRLFLAMIGLLCMLASAVTYSWGQSGRVFRWACLTALLVKGAVYSEHFRSDHVPVDNASQAAKWVNDHIPAESTISQPLSVPHSDCFPPILFSKYRIISFQSEEFKKTKEPLYAIISGPQVEWEPMLKSRGFSLIQRFSESPLQKLGFEDPFTNANFSVRIYRRS